MEPERVDDAITFLHQCLDEALESGVWLELTDVERSELDQALRRDLEHFVREDAVLGLTFVPRRFEVGFGSERAAPELQAGLDLGGFALSGKIDRIDIDPFSARGIVQDYKSGKTAFSAAKIDSELRLQIPLYMLVLRDLVGIEPLGGLYRALAGERDARGLLRASAKEDLPGFVSTDYLDEDEFWHQVETGKERAAALVERIRDGDVEHDPKGGFPCPSWCDLWSMCRVRRASSTAAPNHEQLAAIEAPGVVFVSAGAGTGKTTVLVERYVRAVCDRGLDIESILVITYTERAAGELSSRIRARLLELGRHDLARSLDGAWISTIHGFCHRLLKAHPFAAGIDPRYRVLDDSQSRVVQGEAFQQALTAFCAGEDGERLRLLATYGARGLRRMVTGAFETLRSAGRPLELELPGRSELPERLEELRDAAQCLLDEGPHETVALVLELLAATPAAEELLDLSGYSAKGRARERFATYEEARARVERAALDELARRDRDLLQQLLQSFAEAYRAAKDRDSALDFEDLQLYARDLLRDNEEIRERERWRLRSIMVDEFQDTNRLQCELIDLLAGATTGSREAAAGAGPEGIVLGTAPEGPCTQRPQATAEPGFARLEPTPVGGAWKSSSSSAMSSSRSIASATPTSRSSGSGASRPAACSR